MERVSICGGSIVGGQIPSDPQYIKIEVAPLFLLYRIMV